MAAEALGDTHLIKHSEYFGASGLQRVEIAGASGLQKRRSRFGHPEIVTLGDRYYNGRRCVGLLRQKWNRSNNRSSEPPQPPAAPPRSPADGITEFRLPPPIPPVARGGCLPVWGDDGCAGGAARNAARSVSVVSCKARFSASACSKRCSNWATRPFSHSVSSSSSSLISPPSSSGTLPELGGFSSVAGSGGAACLETLVTVPGRRTVASSRAPGA